MFPQHDIASGVYSFCRQWWGLTSAELTAKKCELLSKSVTEWRGAYKLGKTAKLHRMYQSDRDLLGYLAAFGPRYAYTLYFLLKASKEQLQICARGGKLTVCLLGGGSGVEVIGLLAYLAEQDILPRDVELHYIDRSPQWRRFHAFLFATLMPQYFPRTRVLPYYHDIDLSVSGLPYDSALSRALDARAFVACNLLSEIPQSDGLRENLRVLLRSARQNYYLFVADSNAKKLRPRLSWIDPFLERLGFEHWLYFSGSYEVKCPWLRSNATSARVFPSPGPSFMTNLRRYGFVAKMLADKKGKRN